MLAARALSSRPAAGGLVIAGGDPGFRRRLLKSFAAAHQPRKLVDLGSRPGLETEVAALVPSVVVFDVGATPDAGTFHIVSALSALAKTIVVAATDDDALAIQALKAGASGFCPRNTPPTLIRKAIQLVEAGEIWIGRRVMLRLIEELASLGAATRQRSASAGRLTERETTIAGLVARGAGNKEIAQRLSISVKTVKAHLTNVFKKLGVSSRLQLALEMGPLERSQT
jgi:DNA-binding NarL/FixJ family response regulator